MFNLVSCLLVVLIWSFNYQLCLIKKKKKINYATIYLSPKIINATFTISQQIFSSNLLLAVINRQKSNFNVNSN